MCLPAARVSVTIASHGQNRRSATLYTTFPKQARFALIVESSIGVAYGSCSYPSL